MEIKKLELRNYRNYDSLKIYFDKKNTIFIGNNAQGKTNILESIYVLGLTKSYFNVNDKILIKFNELYTKISAIISNDDSLKKLEILINDKGKKVKIDNQEINKLSNYISNLNVIIFSPDNIRILSESPSFRRKYLNIEISQIFNKYIVFLNDFNKVLKQRNEYLKYIANNSNYDKQYFDILNKKYAELSVEVCLYRRIFINDINDNINSIYLKISGFNNLSMIYISNVDFYEDKEVMINNFINKLESNLNRDLFYKMSLFGPHRDDFSLELDKKNILLYGSQGQTRCAVLALKFSEISIFKKYLNTEPILLLDDIFSELDVNKKNLIVKFIPKDIQTIVTTTDLNLINKDILNNSDVYYVDNGKVIKK